VSVVDISAAHPTPIESADAAEPVTETGSAAPDPTTRMYLQRGVEIVSALVFVVLLLSSLRGSSKGAKGAAPTGSTETGVRAGGEGHALHPGEAPIDPEALARKWASFREEGGLGFGTLRYWAKPYRKDRGG